MAADRETGGTVETEKLAMTQPARGLSASLAGRGFSRKSSGEQASVQKRKKPDYRTGHVFFGAG